jgi:hypothetical protein
VIRSCRRASAPATTPQDDHSECCAHPQEHGVWFGNDSRGDGEGKTIGKGKPVAGIRKYCPVTCGIETQNHIASEKSSGDEEIAARIEGEPVATTLVAKTPTGPAGSTRRIVAAPRFETNNLLLASIVSSSRKKNWLDSRACMRFPAASNLRILPATSIPFLTSV